MIPLIWLAGAAVAGLVGGAIIATFWKEIVGWIKKVYEKLPPSIKQNLQGAMAFLERIDNVLKNIMNYYSFNEQTQKWTETIVTKEVDDLNSIPEHIRKKLENSRKVDITDELQEKLELVA